MSRESYEQHLTAPGTAVSMADASKFSWHRRTCPVCSVSATSYVRCAEGRRLARRMTQPSGEAAR